MAPKRQKLHHLIIDNNKIIILPIIIQKQIINYILNEIKIIIKEQYFINNNEIKLKFKNYALVNQYWFNYSQNFVADFYRYEIDNNKDSSIINNKFNFYNEKIIKKIKINFLDVKRESFINQIKSNFKLLENVQVYVNNEDYVGDSIFDLVNLNKLIENNNNNEAEKRISLNFKLNLNHRDCDQEYNDFQLNFNYQQDKNPFSFKTNKMTFLYDISDYQYPYIYHLIRLLNPINLKFHSDCSISGCEHHLQQFHSISKLNQNYESVIIKNDFIPLYSLYRFLQSPNLKSFQFNLQYHFISRLYSGPNEDKDSDDENEKEADTSNGNIFNMNFNFDEMDNFEFKQFIDYLGDVEIESKDEATGEYYGINEDDQKFCSFNNYDEYNDTIQPYSRSLWNECMKLLTNNKTITNLSISCHDCNGCDWDNESTLYDLNFLNEFMDIFANNKTITSLSLAFDSGAYSCTICDENKNLIFSSIISMLDRNQTLKQLSINYFNEKIDIDNEIKKQTKNTTCEIKTF